MHECDNLIGCPHPAKCDIESIEARLVHSLTEGGAPVTDHDRSKAPVGCFTGSSGDTNVARYPSHDDRFYALMPKALLKSGRREGSRRKFVEYRFARQRFQ